MLMVEVASEARAALKDRHSQYTARERKGNGQTYMRVRVVTRRRRALRWSEVNIGHRKSPVRRMLTTKS